MSNLATFNLLNALFTDPKISPLLARIQIPQLSRKQPATAMYKQSQETDKFFIDRAEAKRLRKNQNRFK
jgi:hypothetical protein